MVCTPLKTMGPNGISSSLPRLKMQAGKTKIFLVGCTKRWSNAIQ